MRRMVAMALGLSVLAGSACSSANDAENTAVAKPSTVAPTTTTTGAVFEVAARSGPRPPQNLVAFDECGSLLRWAKSEAIKTGWGYGFQSFNRRGGLAIADASGVAQRSSAAESPQSPASSPLAASGGDADTSGTNNQEVGVDEADFVKTDGKLLAAISAKFLRVAVREGANWRKAGKLELPDQEGEVLLVGTRALVLQSVYEPIDPQKGDYRARALLIVVDLTNPDRPTISDRYDIDGQVQTARLIGDRVHVVVATSQQLPYVEPLIAENQVGDQYNEAVYKAASEAAIRRTTLKHWVPLGRHFNSTAKPGAERQAVACSATSRPATFGGNTTVTVLSLDPATSAKPISVASVVGVAAQNVYVSPSAVYVTSHRYIDDLPTSGGAPVTDVHRFTLASEGVKYQGSGRIAGYVRDRYSMSEHEGVLRVVASNGWAEASQTSVFTVRPVGDTLAPLGVVNGIGIAEQVQSVRFIGPFAYVVTFLRIDPLHVIDLRDPAKPRLRGELKVPGFSSYLHPLEGNRLLGVGHSATAEGRTTGLQLALFDISNPDAPREIKTVAMPGQHTEVDSDPRAFLWWQPTSLAAIPVIDFPTGDAQGRSYVEPRTEVVGYRVSGDTITEAGRIRHHGREFQGVRSIVSGTSMLTVSRAGLQASNVDTFKETGWLDFASW